MPSVKKKTTRKKTTVVKKDKPDGYVFGRPTKYRVEFCQTVIDIMKEGGAKCEVAAELFIDESTFYEWVKKYPDFSKAVSLGSSLSEAWWTKKGKEHLTHTKNGAQLNTGVYALHMKNRFKWSDKQHTTHDVGEETKKTLAFAFDEEPKNRKD